MRSIRFPFLHEGLSHTPGNFDADSGMTLPAGTAVL